MRAEVKVLFALAFFLGFNSLVKASSAQLFDQFVGFLQSNGVFQFYLPFVILFSMLVGLLNKTQIFGPKTQGLNAIIALSSSLFIMISPAGVTLMAFFSAFFTNILVVLVTVMSMVFVFVLFEPITGKHTFPQEAKYIVIFAGLAALGVFASAGGFNFFGQINFPGDLVSAQDAIFILLLLVTIFVILWLAKGESGGGGDKSKPRQIVIPLDQ